jgi:hypothetical protein
MHHLEAVDTMLSTRWEHCTFAHSIWQRANRDLCDLLSGSFLRGASRARPVPNKCGVVVLWCQRSLFMGKLSSGNERTHHQPHLLVSSHSVVRRALVRAQGLWHMSVAHIVLQAAKATALAAGVHRAAKEVPSQTQRSPSGDDPINGT